MNILFILSISFDIPGPSVHLFHSIIKECLDRGYNVKVILKKIGGGNNTIIDLLSKYNNFSYDFVKFKGVNKNNLLYRYLSEIIYCVSSLKFYLKYKDINVAFIQSTTIAYFQSLIVKKILKCPIVYNVQDLFPLNLATIGVLSKKSLIYKTLSFLQKRCYKNSCIVITISHDIANSLKKQGVDESKISVIYNWSYEDYKINIETSNNKFINKFKINTNNFNVVYAGNIGRMQNVEIIVSAAKILKDRVDIHFIILGDGVYKNKLDLMSVGLNNISFFPMQSDDMAESIYCAADVNVIPLAPGVINTALPSKTATCLRIDKPIIFCIDYNSIFADMVKKYDGISVVKSGDSKKLANEILYLSKNKGKYPIEDRIIFFNKYFNKKNNTKKYVDILNYLCSVKK